MSGEKVGLTHAELEQACRNVGVDLACGACAGQFYTGSAMGEHTCAGYEEKCLEHSALRAVRATKQRTGRVRSRQLVGTRRSDPGREETTP